MDEDNRHTGGLEGRRLTKKSRRSSSILKTGPKFPLSDLDPNQQTEFITTGKLNRKSLARRVSFADTCSVKVFRTQDESLDNHEHDGQSAEQSNSNGKENEAPAKEANSDIAGLDQLLKGQIQDPNLANEEDDVAELPLPDLLPNVPYNPVNQTIYDNDAMDLTACNATMNDEVLDNFGEAFIEEKHDHKSFLEKVFKKSLGLVSVETHSEKKCQLDNCNEEVSRYTSGSRSSEVNTDFRNRRLSNRSPLMCLASQEDHEDSIEEPTVDDFSNEKENAGKNFLELLRLKSKGVNVNRVEFSTAGAFSPIKVAGKTGLGVEEDKTIVFQNNDMEETRPLSFCPLQVADKTSYGDHMEETKSLTGVISVQKRHEETTLFNNENMEETGVLTGYLTKVGVDKTQIYNNDDNMEETQPLTTTIHSKEIITKTSSNTDTYISMKENMVPKTATENYSKMPSDGFDNAKENKPLTVCMASEINKDGAGSSFVDSENIIDGSKSLSTLPASAENEKSSQISNSVASNKINNEGRSVDAIVEEKSVCKREGSEMMNTVSGYTNDNMEETGVLTGAITVNDKENTNTTASIMSVKVMKTENMDNTVCRKESYPAKVNTFQEDLTPDESAKMNEPFIRDGVSKNTYQFPSSTPQSNAVGNAGTCPVLDVNKTSYSQVSMDETKISKFNSAINVGNGTRCDSEDMEQTVIVTSKDIVDKTTNVTACMEETKALTGIVSLNQSVNKTTNVTACMEETKALTGILSLRRSINKTTNVTRDMEETKALTGGITVHQNTNKTTNYSTDMEETKTLTGGVTVHQSTNKTTYVTTDMEVTGGVTLHQSTYKTVNVTTDMEETKALTGILSLPQSINREEKIAMKDDVNNTTMYKDEPMEETKGLSSAISQQSGNKTSLTLHSMVETQPLSKNIHVNSERMYDSTISRNKTMGEVLTLRKADCGRNDDHRGYNEEGESVIEYEDEINDQKKLMSATENVNNTGVTELRNYSSLNDQTEISPECEETEILNASSYLNFIDKLKKSRKEMLGDLDGSDSDEDLEEPKKEDNSVKKSTCKRRSMVRLSTTAKIPLLEKTEGDKEGLEVKCEDRSLVESERESVGNKGEPMEEDIDTHMEKHSLKGNNSIAQSPNSDDPMEGIMEQMAPEMMPGFSTETTIMSPVGQKLSGTLDRSASSARLESKTSGKLSQEDKNLSRTETVNTSLINVDSTAALLAQPTGLTVQVQTHKDINETTIGESCMPQHGNLSLTKPQNEFVRPDTVGNKEVSRRQQEMSFRDNASSGLTAHIHSENDTMYSLHSNTTHCSGSDESTMMHQDAAGALMSSMSINMLNVNEESQDEDEEEGADMNIDRFCTKFLKVQMPLWFLATGSKRCRSSIARPQEFECEDLKSKLEVEIIHGSQIKACKEIFEDAVSTAESKARDMDRLNDSFIKDPPDWVKAALTGITEEEKFVLHKKVSDLIEVCPRLSRKLHLGQIKYESLVAYKDVLKSKLLDLNSKLENTIELTSTAKETLEMLKEVEAELDDHLSQSECPSSQEDAEDDISRKIVENNKKIKELKDLEKQLQSDVDAHQKKSAELEAELSSLQKKADTDLEEEMADNKERDDLEAVIPALRSLSAWIWHEEQSNQETEVFLLYKQTIALFIDKEPCPQNGVVKITNIQMQSLIEGNEEPQIQIGHSVLMKILEDEMSHKKYSTVDKISQLLHEVSKRTIDVDDLISDIDKAGLLDDHLVTWNVPKSSATLEKWCLEALRKVEINLALHVEDSEIKILPDVEVIYGKMSADSVMKLIQCVEQGPDYVQRLCNAVNLSDFESLCDVS